MTITRRGLYEEINRYDTQIAELNKDKAGCFEAYRNQMAEQKRSKPEITAEISACKNAFRRHRALDKNADAVLSKDALVDEIVAELQKPSGTRNAIARAPRTSRPVPPAHRDAPIITPDSESQSAAVPQPGQPSGDGEAIAAPAVMASSFSDDDPLNCLPQFLDRREVLRT